VKPCRHGSARHYYRSITAPPRHCTDTLPSPSIAWKASLAETPPSPRLCLDLREWTAPKHERLLRFSQNDSLEGPPQPSCRASRKREAKGRKRAMSSTTTRARRHGSRTEHARHGSKHDCGEATAPSMPR
jgi:hypothetical protein